MSCGESVYQGIAAFLHGLPDELHPETYENTPGRWSRAMTEMTSGYLVNVPELLDVQFDRAHYGGIVVLRNIEFSSLCEHHLLPFTGTADVGYLPSSTGGVVGLSKLARLVEAYARRLQLQERMTQQIADALMAEPLNAGGSIVVVRAHHSCMGCRGVRKPSAEMVTSCVLGVLRDKPEARAEALTLVGRIES